jgi:hypothetical protein
MNLDQMLEMDRRLFYWKYLWKKKDQFYTDLYIQKWKTPETMLNFVNKRGFAGAHIDRAFAIEKMIDLAGHDHIKAEVKSYWKRMPRGFDYQKTFAKYMDQLIKFYGHDLFKD